MVWRPDVQEIQQIRHFNEVFVTDLTVSDTRCASGSAAAGGAGAGLFERDQSGPTGATGSRGVWAGEGRADEATQYRPVALEVGFTIL